MGLKHTWGTRSVSENEHGSLEVSLNLTPLMDVMSNILFFLLAAFGSSAVAVIATVVPTQSQETASPPPEGDVKDEVTAMLRVEQGGGMTLTFTSETVQVDMLQSMRRTWTAVQGVPDVKSLSVALQEAKEKYPESKSIVIVADDDEKYQTLVDVMDASREVALGSGQRLKLFHNVVLSGFPTNP
jgi:biopolymer transport protein ExbD